MDVDKTQLMARGRTAEVYSRNEKEVLKLFYDWCPPEWSSREAEISRLVSSRGLSTPRCLEAVELNGRRGLVYEKINGPSMLSAMSRRPWSVVAQAKAFAELHFRAHAAKGRGLRGVRAHLDAAIGKADLPTELRRKALNALSNLPDGISLCHFDFHPDQVILSGSGPVIIDWMSALEGDATADVARTIVLLRFATPPKATWVYKQAINLVRKTFTGTYLRMYNRLAGPGTSDRIRKWMIPVAAARLRDGIADERAALLRFLSRAHAPRGDA